MSGKGREYWNKMLFHLSYSPLLSLSSFDQVAFSALWLGRFVDCDDIALLDHAEEDALMDLLQFMYSGKVNADTPTTVLDVLMAADKFEVQACMRHCSRLLRNMPMSPEFALLYLELPSSVLSAEAVQPLTDAARVYLATKYRDIGR